MVKIYVNDQEIETERPIEPDPLFSIIDGMAYLLNPPELPTEFEEFFQYNKDDFGA